MLNLGRSNPLPLKPFLPKLLLIAMAFWHGSALLAQKQPAGWKGEIRGSVRDQAQDSILKSATVAIYKAKDSSLVAVRLTDAKGEFSIVGVPADIVLRLVVSYIGFESRERSFTLTAAKDQIDVGAIGLLPRSTTLAEVVVGPPPVRMKGDTLEFNSEAFKLGPIAQAEDLLRVLPGVTMWMADGTITVNGKKISEVLVNGKPFFGTDSKVALQNLPKNIVEKIQVYQRANPDLEKKDSASILDIRLKKGKDFGYFGKLDAGYGTSGHYESNATLNYFNGRNQVGAVFTSNDVNKVAGDLSYVLRNNTFKGAGANTEYQSNFSVPGVNTFTSAGVLLQHDFVDTPSYKNKNELAGVYFYNNRGQHLKQTTRTTTTVNDTTTFNTSSLNESHSNSFSQQENLKYEKIFKDNWLTVEGIHQSTNSNSSGQQEGIRTDRTNLPLSRQTSSIRSDGSNNSYNILATLMNYMTMKRKWNSSYIISYQGYFFNNSSTQKNQTSYLVNADSGQNTFINRIYHPVTDQTNQTLYFRLPNLGMLLLGESNSKTTSIGIENRVNVTTGKNNNAVYDQNETTNVFSLNDILSNRQHDLAYEFKPSLSLGKNWMKQDPKYPNRGTFYGQILLTEDLYGYKSWSVQSIQNLTRTYQTFIPSANLNYNVSRPDHNSSARIAFSTEMKYPYLQQLAPLVDNSNPSYIRYGNINLQQQKTENLELFYGYGFSKPRSNYSLASAIRGSSSNSYLSSSMIIDSLGRTQYTPVNVRGYRRLSIVLNLKGNFVGADANKLQIQATLTPEYTIEHSPRYVNRQFSYYDNLNVVVTPTLNITYKDWLTINVMEREGWTRSTQTNRNTFPLTNHTSSTELSGWIKVTRSFSLASNINYTSNTSTASPRTAFTLWNASASYRFFKDQTGELKFSALDLLHQNTALTNSAIDNTITHGNSNLLQQYFMLTAAWHPRKFGKGQKLKP